MSFPSYGPSALYNNLPIESDNYKPSRYEISAVTLGKTTLVTTSVDNNYVVGQIVRLLIPSSFGCTQLNNQQGYVVSLPSSTQVEIAIDSSRNVNEYIASSETNVAQIIAIGDINTGQINTNYLSLNLNIPGSFQNISPQ